MVHGIKYSLLRHTWCSVYIPVPGEEVVEHAECRFKVTVHYILWSGLWSLQTSVLHQFKGKGHIVDLLVKILWGEEKVVERHKISLQQPHQQHQINTICKLCVQFRHLKVELVEVFVHKRDQCLFDDIQFIWSVVKQGVESVALMSARESLCVASDFLLNLSGLEDALSFLDNHYLNGDMVWQSDRCSEVLRQCHQQVQDGNYTLSMNRVNIPANVPGGEFE